jgi:hypothetical protein
MGVWQGQVQAKTPIVAVSLGCFDGKLHWQKSAYYGEWPRRAHSMKIGLRYSRRAYPGQVLIQLSIPKGDDCWYPNCSKTARVRVARLRGMTTGEFVRVLSFGGSSRSEFGLLLLATSDVEHRKPNAWVLSPRVLGRVEWSTPMREPFRSILTGRQVGEIPWSAGGD